MAETTAKPDMRTMLELMSGQSLENNFYQRPDAQELVSKASSVLYGDIGANLDTRDWDAIMKSADPYKAAQEGLKSMYSDPTYLVKNAENLLAQGYLPEQADITYKQMESRVGSTYDPNWSAGSQFAGKIDTPGFLASEGGTTKPWQSKFAYYPSYLKATSGARSPSLPPLKSVEELAAEAAEAAPPSLSFQTPNFLSPTEMIPSSSRLPVSALPAYTFSPITTPIPSAVPQPQAPVDTQLPSIQQSVQDQFQQRVFGVPRSDIEQFIASRSPQPRVPEYSPMLTPTVSRQQLEQLNRLYGIPQTPPQDDNMQFFREGGAVKKFADGGPSSGVRRLEMSGYQAGGEVTDDMFVGTRPEDFPETSPVDKKAGELLRALSEGTRGFVGAEPIEPGSEAYRTGQALANMPAVGVVAATAKGAGKSVGQAKALMERMTPELEKFLKDSVVKERLYRGQRRAPAEEGFALTQGRGTPSFTTDTEVANVYSRQLGFGNPEYGPGSTVVPAYVQMKNPLDIRDLGEYIDLESFVNRLPNVDLNKPTVKNGFGYEDIAKMVRGIGSVASKTGAKYEIEASSPGSIFRVTEFDELADAIEELGEAGKSEKIQEMLFDTSIDAFLIGDSKNVKNALKEKGFDGVIHKDAFDVGGQYYQGDPKNLEGGTYAEYIHDSYRPFFQEKIKSAVGNVGTYDTTKKAITKAQGGEVTNDEYIQEMMTGTRPTDETTSPGILPPEIRKPVDVGLDFANMALRGTAAAVAGPAYGLYKGVTSGQYGTPEGVRVGEQAAADLMTTITGQPKTQEARDIMDFVGEKVEQAKIPMMPQFLTMPLPAPGSARAAMQALDMDKPPTGAVTLAAPPAPSLDSLGMSSRLSEAVSKLQAKGTGEQLLAQLNKTQGVPQAEIKATGLDEFLKSAGKVTRDDIQGYLEKNKVNLVEDERSFAGAPIDDLSKKTMGKEFPYLRGDFFNRRYADLDQVKEAGYNALKAERDELQEQFTYGDLDLFRDRDGFEVLPDELDDWFQRENDYLEQYIDDIALEDSRVKHNQLTLPGGENYREVLFKLPQKEGQPSFIPPASHYEDAANTFGSIRMTDRVVDGKPILFAEEVQSDWAIKGAKEGYDEPEKVARRNQQLSEARQALAQAEARAEAAKNAFQNRGPQDESLQLLGNMEFAKQNAEKVRRFIQALEIKATPENPFKNNWYQPVMNRFLIKAAQEGKAGIGLTNGEVHIQRYNLRNYADKLKYNPDLKLLEVYGNAADESPIKTFQNIDREKLGKQIGQDMAGKLLASKAADGEFVLQGKDLEVGGGGKNTFYDKILPDYLNKLGKKYGVKLETRMLPAFGDQQKSAVNPLGRISDEKAREIYYLPITEEMRNDLLGKGLPTFKEGGEVTNDEFIQQMMTGTPMSDTTTQPGILPPEIRQAVDVPLDFANLLIRGTAAVPIGGVAGLYKGVTGGKYGTQEGVKEADTEAARMMAEITGEPKTQAAKDVLEFIGGKAQEYKLDAALPQLLTLPSPGPGAASALSRAAMDKGEELMVQKMREITGNPDLTATQVYDAMFEKQTPGAAIAPPKQSLPTSPDASTDLGIKKLEGGLIFPEDETAERLRLKVQRRQAFEEKGKAMPGAPKNARTVIKAPKDSGLPDFVVGDIRPQDWIARTENLLSPDEIQQYGRWYDDVRGTFLKYTDGDEKLTDKYMRAWLVANQNIGVEGAFNNVLLQAEQFARKVPQDQMRAGGLPFATQAARNALQDQPITEGVGLKIADFVDSAEGKGTRSIYGNDQQAGAPFVVDIHTARDTGLVDDILLNHLERSGYKVDRSKIKTDLATGPTDTQYENRADFGRDLTSYLNQNNWQGRSDWTPKEIQAIGWMAMTKLTRDAADDTVTALERSLRRLSMEFSPGEGSPWATRFGERFKALDPEGQRELTQVATSRAVEMAKQVSGIDLRNIVHGSGGWQKFQNPATVAQALATKEGSEIAANALGYLLNQTEVWSNAIKGMTKNPKAFAIDFVQLKGDDLSTDQGIMGFWEKVMETDPTGLFVGYQPIRTADNQPGIRVIVDKGGAKRMQDIQAALEGPIAKMIKDSPLDIDARGYENELVKAVNNWKENPDGQLYLARLADLGVGSPATRLDPLRGELETAIESWFENRAGAAKPGAGKRAAPTTSEAPAARGVAPEIGINVASDIKAGAKYADLIVDGQKTLESRDTDSLRPYVGRRVAIVRTGEGQAKAIGAATIGEPILVDAKKFRELQNQHLVPEGSKFDIKGGNKYLYPIIDPERFGTEQEVGKGIVARRVRGKGTTTAAEDLAAVSSTAPAVSRVEMSYKDVTKRVPQLTKGANDLLDGKITWEDYNALVDQYKPVTPYSFVPAPATAADAMKALDSRKQKSFAVVQEGIQAGENAELRLDIPAYKDHGVWVNSIHRSGQPTSYASISSIKNARMIGPDDVRLQEKALEVATGQKSKGPFAVIKGEWSPVSEKEAVARAQQYLNDPEWTQVGYDPERHSYFYDRTTTQPVVSADEVLQIGPLVLAKKAKFAKKEQFKFKDGGEVNAFIKAKAK
jgi:hypothetical protein